MARLVREGVFESRQSRVSGSRSHERFRSPVYILMGEFGPAFLLFTCHSYKVDVMDGASHGAEPYQCMPICRIELSICFHSRSGTGNGDGCHGHEHDRLLSNVPLAQDRRHHQGYYRQAGMRIAAQAAHRTGSIVDMDTGASEFGDIGADARVVPDRGVVVTNAEAMALTEAFGSATTTSRTTWQSTSPPTKRVARTTQATGSCGLTRTQKP